MALTPHPEAEALGQLVRARPDKVALLLGAEGPGLTAATADRLDALAHIPIHEHDRDIDDAETLLPRAEAHLDLEGVAVRLHEVERQRLEDLSPEELEAAGGVGVRVVRRDAVLAVRAVAAQRVDPEDLALRRREVLRVVAQHPAVQQGKRTVA